MPVKKRKAKVWNWDKPKTGSFRGWEHKPKKIIARKTRKK